MARPGTRHEVIAKHPTAYLKAVVHEHIPDSRTHFRITERGSMAFMLPSGSTRINPTPYSRAWRWAFVTASKRLIISLLSLLNLVNSLIVAIAYRSDAVHLIISYAGVY